jgi:DNA-binding response OmpR family regulator
MTDARLLLVEDDPALARSLTAALASEGYEVVTCGTAADVARTPLSEVDLVLLDLSLPDADGLDVCRRLRVDGWLFPIVMLTARQDEADVVIGLDAGASDYVTKPFRLAELYARLRAHLRRVPSDRELAGVVSAGDVTVDIGARRAFVSGEEIDLRPKEFDLLAFLVTHAGQVLTRERIMERVWDAHWYGSTKTLDMHVSAVRRKLADAAPALRTIRNVGYRFDA